MNIVLFAAIIGGVISLALSLFIRESGLGMKLLIVVIGILLSAIVTVGVIGTGYKTMIEQKESTDSADITDSTDITDITPTNETLYVILNGAKHQILRIVSINGTLVEAELMDGTIITTYNSNIIYEK